MNRDLFFKTTKARHPSGILRFVYSYLRLRRRMTFFVRPRSRFSAFMRLRILRKMFVWLYTDRFLRLSFFRRFIRYRRLRVRSFLAFCTRLESFLPVILCRFHFVANMRIAFSAIALGRVYINGASTDEKSLVVRLGDYVELYYRDVFQTLGFLQLLRSLPRIRFSLQSKDLIVDIRRFYAVLATHMSFFTASANRAVAVLLPERVIATLLNKKSFFLFFIARLFFILFQDQNSFSSGGLQHTPYAGLRIAKISFIETHLSQCLWWRTHFLYSVFPINWSLAIFPGARMDVLPGSSNSL